MISGESNMIQLLGRPLWINVGPNPIAVKGANSISGAIQRLVAHRITHPTGPDTYILYAGSVNGGVWRADNFVDTILQAQPALPIRWTPVSDQAPTLSVGSLALDPLDKTGNTVWVGTGSFSSTREGGKALGLLKTTNGRDAAPTWITLGDQMRQRTDVNLTDQRISSVIPTTLMDRNTGQQIILVAAFDGGAFCRAGMVGKHFRKLETSREDALFRGKPLVLSPIPTVPKHFTPQSAQPRLIVPFKAQAESSGARMAAPRGYKSTTALGR
jgi:hypothetical protein